MQNSESNRSPDEQRAGCEQQTLAPHAQRSSGTLRHDAENTLLEIRSRDAGDACDCWFRAERADLQNALCINFPPCVLFDDPFIACPFTLFAQTCAHPTDERMEPEKRFHKGMNRGGQIVVAAHVFYLVRHDRFDLRFIKTVAEPLRPEQNGPKDAENPRLYSRGGKKEADWQLNLSVAASAKKSIELASTGDWFSGRRHTRRALPS